MCIMQEKIIYLLRHGNTGFKNRYIGSSDVPLSPEGREEAKSICDYLTTIPLDKILCSPLKRCRETVSYLKTGLRIEYDNCVKEIDFGRWEKKSFQEICHIDQSLVDNWVSDAENFTFPEGESLLDFKNRVVLAASHLERSQCKHILVVCHGGVIRHLICSLLRVPHSQYLLYDVHYGSIAKIHMHECGGVLTGLNLTPVNWK